MLRARKANTNTTIECVSFQNVPAKSFNNGGKIDVGRSVENHCRIVGEVAKELIRRSVVSSLFPKGSAFIAAIHDIGKVSPTFYNKIMNACSRQLLPNVNHALEKNWNGHAGVSQLTAKYMGAPEYIPEIIGQHHGFSPAVSGMRATDDNFGGIPWLKERQKLVAALSKALNETWPNVESNAQARLLAGLTTVSDWIGSGFYFENPNTPWEDKIEQAVDDAGFVPVIYRSGMTFHDVFGFSPRQVQQSLIDQINGPGVYALEAPMGVGKTEAALYAAYRVLEKGLAGGIYFALPTQLTSNKIYHRFQSFLEQILAPECQHRSLLLHANAWLYEKDLGEEGRPGGAWFNQSKRGLLAPFAVGTIDQALMGAMNVKHGFVRTFGLAGKVVILDEVHTYDAFTSTLLEALIDLLRQLKCTVIILSATLNQQRRRQLLKRTTYSNEYPLITSSPNDEADTVYEISAPAEECKQYKITLQVDDSLAIEEALIRAGQGQQVLWIENTVHDAQQRYLDLAARAAELGIDSGLLHSRFTADHRQAIEEKWVNLFGKPGWPSRGKQGRILVGTQVLEQSLDIDADFLITRFAPTDMLFQRIGRLWRHSATPRCQSAIQEAWLLAPELEKAIENPIKHFGGTALVYSPYVLCRSLEVWQEIYQLSLPNDIRNLIEQTYASREEDGAMSRWLYELEEGSRYRKGRKSLQQLARVGLSQAGITLPESKAQTRYSDSDNHEVLLLQAIAQNGERALLTLLDGTQIELPLQRSKLSRGEWRILAAQLMRQIVNVPLSIKPKSLSVDKLRRFGLHNCFYLGNADWENYDESILGLAVVDETGKLRGIEGTDIHDNFIIEYRDDLGYRVIKE